MRNMIFGAEDALVSTVGFLFGVAASGQYTTKLLMLSGIVLISVEALSMGVGSYLTETTVQKVDDIKKHKDLPIIDGLLMFLAYFAFGTFVLAPYTFIELNIAKYVSVAITMTMLFIVGFLPARALRDGLRMFFTAGAAIALGFLVARIV
jgi:VIT1/CCC1 family predicted Fe2+/Mn2+ transporter